MATSKLLKPTNVTISIPEFTDQPDQRVNSNGLDKEADAINALSEQIGKVITLDRNTSKVGTFTNVSAVSVKNVLCISGYFTVSSAAALNDILFTVTGITPSASKHFYCMGADGVVYSLYFDTDNKIKANGAMSAQLYYISNVVVC